jgi:hypothetical protein
MFSSSHEQIVNDLQRIHDQHIVKSFNNPISIGAHLK